MGRVRGQTLVCACGTYDEPKLNMFKTITNCKQVLVLHEWLVSGI